MDITIRPAAAVLYRAMARSPTLTPGMLLEAYRAGAFPMASGRGGEVAWYTCDPRAILPLTDEGLHVSRSLRKTLRRGVFEVRMDTAFEAVIRACAQPRGGDGDGDDTVRSNVADETWINDAIITAFCQMHELGYAHSVEAWARDDNDADNADDATLVGGVYGLAIGGAFFGESMFSRRADASKVALVALWEHLRSRGYTLFDTQYANAHTQRLGVIDIPAAAYHRLLRRALRQDRRWRD